jgi:hypothetical protein
MGLGISILANSRPFEGLVACIPACIALVFWLTRRTTESMTMIASRCLLPLGAVLALLMAGMLTYNRAVTGGLFLMPHAAYSRAYEPCSAFVPLGVRPLPEYNHEVLRRFFVDWHLDLLRTQQSLAGWAEIRVRELKCIVYFIGPLALPLFLLPWCWHRRAVLFAVLTCALLITAEWILLLSLPHYYAPVACMFFLVLAECSRQLYVVQVSRLRIGRYLALASLCLVPLNLFLAAYTRAGEPLGLMEERAIIQRQLEGTGGRHLVIVRYRPDHPVRFEFVANRADIDRSKVVWAREMDEARNRRLLDYYRDRSAWLLEADELPLALVPYALGRTAGGAREVYHERSPGP